MESRRDHAVLYDSDCGFCKLSVRGLLRLDRDERLRAVAIQSDEGQRLLTEVPRGEAARERPSRDPGRDRPLRRATPRRRSPACCPRASFPPASSAASRTPPTASIAGSPATGAPSAASACARASRSSEGASTRPVAAARRLGLVAAALLGRVRVRGRGRPAPDRLPECTAERARAPPTGATSPTAPSSHSPTPAARPPGVEVELEVLDDADASRLGRGPQRRQRRSRRPGLDGDRLHRRARLRRDPDVAADHERGGDAAGLAGQRRREPDQRGDRQRPGAEPDPAERVRARSAG